MDKWALVEELAVARGLKPATVKKWRQRGGVSREWTVELLQELRSRPDFGLSDTDLFAMARPLSATKDRRAA